MLYEEQILIQLEQKGFQRDKVVRYLDANKHNHETTCYYLILKKLEKEGKIDKGKYFSGENFLSNQDDQSEKYRSLESPRDLDDSEYASKEFDLKMKQQYISKQQMDQIKERKQLEIQENILKEQNDIIEAQLKKVE